MPNSTIIIITQLLFTVILLPLSSMMLLASYSKNISMFQILILFYFSLGDKTGTIYIFFYIYVYIYTYVYIYICIYICIYINIYIYVHIYSHLDKLLSHRYEVAALSY